jgi:two-component system, cell cycle sensor histidine kinase DivJ
MATVALQWLKMNWNASSGLALDARLHLFRSCRLVAAVLMLGVFPAMAMASSEPLAVVAALVLYGVLPAAVAVDVRRPEELDRAIIASLLISEIVLIGGVLRGLPPISALSLISVVCIEAYVVGSKSIRIKITTLSALTCFAIAAIMMSGSTLLPEGFEGEVSFWAPLTVAVALIVNVAMLTRALLGSVELERSLASDQRILAHEIEAIVSETVVAIDRSGSAVRISDNASRVLGLTVESLRGRGFSEMVLVVDRPQFLTALSDCAHGGIGRKLRVRMRASSDNTAPQYRWVEASVSASHAASDIAIATLRDISEQVLEEEGLLASAAEAEMAKSARGAFLTTVNHELRTPLNAIIGFSEILANPATLPQSPERMQEYAEIINNAGHDLLRMVTTMIDVTRLDSGVYEFDAEIMDLRRVIEHAVEAYRGEAEAKDTEFVIGSAPNGLEANIDTRALRNILNQLLSNAVKFGDGRHPVVLALARNDAMIDISISNHGVGIAKEKLETLGRHFSRGDEGLGRETGGIGLGLSLARGLTELHGGKMSITSVLGKSTTVTLSIPAAGSSAISAPSIVSSNVHVLVAPQALPAITTDISKQNLKNDRQRIRA